MTRNYTPEKTITTEVNSHFGRPKVTIDDVAFQPRDFSLSLSLFYWQGGDGVHWWIEAELASEVSNPQWMVMDEPRSLFLSLGLFESDSKILFLDKNESLVFH